MKTRAQKEVILQGLKDQFSGKTPGVVIAGFKGMTVAQVTKLRTELRPFGARFTVLKNTLARIAAKGTPFEKAMENLEGPRAVAVLGEDGPPAVKALIKLIKEIPTLELLGGSIEGATYNLEGLKAYSEMPSKDQVRAMFVGVLNAPMSQFVSVLNAPGRDMVGVLRAQADKLEKETGAAA